MSRTSGRTCTPIRIAGDFYDFLAKSHGEPRAREVAYVLDTIRSGMDEFFSLAYICRNGTSQSLVLHVLALLDSCCKHSSHSRIESA